MVLLDSVIIVSDITEAKNARDTGAWSQLKPVLSAEGNEANEE